MEFLKNAVIMKLKSFMTIDFDYITLITLRPSSYSYLNTTMGWSIHQIIHFHSRSSGPLVGDATTDRDIAGRRFSTGSLSRNRNLQYNAIL